MHPRTRKLIGTVVLTLFLIAYAFAAMLVAVVLEVRQVSGFVEVLYYVFAGLLWVIPAGALIWWMQKDETAPSETARR